MQATVTDDHEAIIASDKVIFPGVGEASSAMKYLSNRGLDEVIKNLKQPVLGICLGMQLMCSHLKVPQIGWNRLSGISAPLFTGIVDSPYCYFVHSYYAALCNETAAVTEYGIRFSSALQKNNFYGVQFHPEKSAVVGEQILKNFISL